MDRLFRVLSIDGGGIRGIVPAIFLTEIERRTGRRISSLLDLIAGRHLGRRDHRSRLDQAETVTRQPGEDLEPKGAATPAG